MQAILPLVLLPALSLLAGWLDYGLARGHGDVTSAGYAIAAIALVFAWFLADARRRRFHPSRSLKCGVVVLGVVSVPYYLFKSRGGRGGARALAWALLLFVVAMACYGAGAALAT